MHSGSGPGRGYWNLNKVDLKIGLSSPMTLTLLHCEGNCQECAKLSGAFFDWSNLLVLSLMLLSPLYHGQVEKGSIQFLF